jgi:hypothetical protein
MVKIQLRLHYLKPLKVFIAIVSLSHFTGSIIHNEGEKRADFKAQESTVAVAPFPSEVKPAAAVRNLHTYYVV